MDTTTPHTTTQTPTPRGTSQTADSATQQGRLDRAHIATDTCVTEKELYQMFKVVPGLYISKFPTTIPVEITHILNMCTHPHPADDTNRAYLHIPILDIDNITPHIPSITTFISNALKQEGKVLVHCALRLNRSAAAVLAFLCFQKEMTAAEALKCLKERKPNVSPSAIFMGQINRYFGREESEKVEDPMNRERRQFQIEYESRSDEEIRRYNTVEGRRIPLYFRTLKKGKVRIKKANRGKIKNEAMGTM
ncbi:uncharacterized protein PAC_11348 [Phialocephala subalpina]|uniref:protein-tyrosine-phosphatase n=1 Tax=Phialocephala subalpina TaxID=576137 RepID=A0A1L7X8W4_9HELO|nr:uncharacterized protein PAC_11348 [Phialocephala subalpina]